MDPSRPFLTREEALKFLKDFEIIPSEHRLYLWMNVVLNLPNNKSDYLHLREKGKKLTKENVEYCHGCDSTKKKHKRVFYSLITHCPSLEKLEGFNINSFIEPFCELLSKHEMAFFEIILTVIVNWCQHWFDHTPLKPHTLLSMLDIMLLKADRDLYQHLARRGVRARDYAWKWMATAFQDVVDPKEWMILWDHILANEPSFMYFIPLAACKLLGKHVMNLGKREEILGLLVSSNPFDVQTLLKEAYKLDDTIPTCCHPSRILNAFSPLICGTYPVVNPMELITLGSDVVGVSDLDDLLRRVAATHKEIDEVVEKGMKLRRNLIGSM